MPGPDGSLTLEGLARILRDHMGGGTLLPSLTFSSAPSRCGESRMDRGNP